MTIHDEYDDEVDEDYQQMLADLESGECAVISYSGTVMLLQQDAGPFNEWDEQIAAIKQAMDEAKYLAQHLLRQRPRQRVIARQRWQRDQGMGLMEDPATDIFDGRATGFGTPEQRARWHKETT